MLKLHHCQAIPNQLSIELKSQNGIENSAPHLKMIASIIFHDFPLDIDYVVSSDIPEIAAKKLDGERLEIRKKNAVCKCRPSL